MTQQVIEPTYTDTLDYPYSGKRVMTDGNAIISRDPATEKWSIAGNPESKRSVAKFEGDFIQDFCKYEGRFRSQFDDAGTPSHLLHEQVEENLRIWNILQKNAGVEPRD
ncbi:MAG: hypothetical protein HOC93_01080 [Phycisphaerae bacterium]|jgi:hypothetical protein|nr:hypothetical protein [Phycisphaerae bacterium]